MNLPRRKRAPAPVETEENNELVVARIASWLPGFEPPLSWLPTPTAPVERADDDSSSAQDGRSPALL